MADKKKTTVESVVPEGVKKTLNQAGELAKLKLRRRRLLADRKEAYARLGELVYVQKHPRKGVKPADLDSAIDAATAEITRLSRELLELSVSMELLKTDMKS